MHTQSLAMFLHSGASLHGHEFSNRPHLNHAPNHHSAHAAHRLRSAFVSPGRSRSPQPPTPTTELSNPTSHRPSLDRQDSLPLPRIRRPRPISEYVPRKDQNVVRFQEEPIIVGATPRSSIDTAHDDSASELSDTTTSDSTVRRKRRSIRSSKPKQATNLALAYPPPRLRTKQRRFVQIRPKLLLQLQQLSVDKRPKPTIDVLATSVVAGTHIVPRLVRHFPNLFRTRRSLGRDDLVLARSEDYDAPSGADTADGQDLDKRDLVAVISPILPGLTCTKEGEAKEPKGQGQAEIVLADGSFWTAKTLANGSYEFVHINSRGETKTVRWVKKAVKSNKAFDRTSSPAPSPENQNRFTFSIIDPSSRRHPILATLTPSNLEILDSYTTLSQSSLRYPPSRPFSLDLDSCGGVAALDAPPPPPPRTTCAVDQDTRDLITVTSVWVALRDGPGWPMQVPRPPQIPQPSNLTINPRARPNGMERARATTFPLSPSDVAPASPQTPSSPMPNAIPRRALSTGAAYMQRRQAKMAENEPSAPTTPVTAETDETDDLKRDMAAASSEKRGICRRIRNWGARIATHSKKGGPSDD